MRIISSSGSLDSTNDTQRMAITRQPGQPVSITCERVRRLQTQGGTPVVLATDAGAKPRDLTFSLSGVTPVARRNAIIAGLQAIEAMADDLDAAADAAALLPGDP
jgi:hypothetical protein